MITTPENLRKINEQSLKHTLYLTDIELSYRELKGLFNFTEHYHVRARHLLQANHQSSLKR